MKMSGILIMILVLTASAFTLMEKYPFTIPAGWPKPIYAIQGQALQEEQVLLGRVLFYDPILSADHQISCASCHSPYNAFAHTDHALSHGIHDSIGKRNAPALMNLAWKSSFMWDGSIKKLDEQPLVPITHAAEMGEDMDHVLEKMRNTELYPKLFTDAYGDGRISKQRMMHAITQFMLSLVSSNSKYDSVIRKQAAFTEQENRGYTLFRAHCAACHAEPLFTNDTYSYNGLPLDERLKDEGLKAITHRKKDSLLFKVPSLRNVQYSYPYMHDGRFKKLSEVLEHYASGISDSKNLTPALARARGLSSNDKVDLIAFLLTLSDKPFIFEKRHQFPDILKTTYQ